MKYDVILFNDEFDILDLRLAELQGAVDQHVIVESDISMRGKEKPLHFANRSDAYKAWNIQHRVHHAEPYQESLEANEAFQRQLRSSLDTLPLQDDDTVLFSDADEIPRREFVQQYSTSQGAVRLRMRSACYFFNVLPCAASRWSPYIVRPIIGPGALFKAVGFNSMRWHYDTGFNVEPNGGWHFSFLGGYDALMRKLSCHGEGFSSDWILSEKRAVIEDRINRAMLYDGSEQFDIVPINGAFPKTIRDNIDKYKSMGYIK